MKNEWVNLAFIANNSTTNTQVRIIAPKDLLVRWAQDNPYVTLYPHQVVVFTPPLCYKDRTQEMDQ